MALLKKGLVSALQEQVQRLSNSLARNADDDQKRTDQFADQLHRGLAEVVPVGTVVDWYRPNKEIPIPEGFQVCDGSPIASGPFKGRSTPNLVDRFVMGVSADRMGEVGGASNVTLQIDHTHGVTPCNDANGHNALKAEGWHDYHPNCAERAATSTGGSSLPRVSFDNRPQYFGLLKLMRVK